MTFFGKEVNGGADDAIRLDASDIVYQCIAHNNAHPDEPPLFPKYGGFTPDDWDGQPVLMDSGHFRIPRVDSWEGVIGYSRRPATSHPEPVGEKPVLTTEMQRLIVAARHVAYDDAFYASDSEGLLRELDQAVEAFATDVPWDGSGRVSREMVQAYRAKIHGNESVPAYSAVEMAQHYDREAGGVLVPWMTESEAVEWLSSVSCNAWEALEALKRLGIIRPEPTPLEIARAEYPDADPAMIERIVQIAKGEAK